ncbi:MAG TPA: hypothetical protein VJ717_09390 [Gemmatimonadaceae bacterium]|nr:hypothetical protein [Gemmatimonadaceae bacterium]
MRPTPAAPIPSVGATPDALARSLAGQYIHEQIEERAEAARRNRARRPWRQFLATAIIVACGAVWLVPSLGTRPVPAISTARMDASVRLTLFLASQKVREYEQRNRRLPATATQSGITDQRIEYRLTSKDAFMLSMTQDGRRWELPSSMADSIYMRDALAGLGISK